MTTQETPSPKWNATTKLIVALAALALIGWVVWRFTLLITPLIAAAMVAYLLNPLITALVDRLKWRRTLVVALVYVVLLLLLAGSATGVSIYVANQISVLNRRVVQIVEGLPQRLEEVIHGQIAFLGYAVDLSQFDFNALYDQLLAAIRPALSQVGTFVGRLASGTAEFFGWALFVLVISFYMVKDMPNFGGALARYASGPGYQHDVARLLREFQRTWDAFLRGQAILAVSIALIVWIGLTVLGVRFALGLALLAGLLEFVPIIGPLVAGAVAVGVALFQDTNWLNLSPFTYAIVVAVFYIVVQQLENNFFVPRIIGHHLDLHPIVVMVGAIMGASLGGILGLLLAAPVMASLRLVGRYAWRKMLDVPPFPEPERLEQKPVLAMPKIQFPRWLSRK